MLTHSTAVYRVISDRLGDVGMAAGHSLGEFSAHVAAGTLDFGDALRTVRLRGELMYSAGQDRLGTMAAVLGLDDDVLISVCVEASAEAGTCVPANFNSRGQVVISGDVAGVERAMELALEEGAKRVVKLSVSGAFHSPLMAPAEDGLREHLEGDRLQGPELPSGGKRDGEARHLRRRRARPPHPPVDLSGALGRIGGADGGVGGR